MFTRHDMSASVSEKYFKISISKIIINCIKYSAQLYIETSKNRRKEYFDKIIIPLDRNH